MPGMNAQKPGWRCRWWLLKIHVTSRIDACFVRCLGRLHERWGGRRLGGQLGILLRWLPRRWLGRDYRLAVQNLSLWHIDGAEADQRARTYVAIEWQRQAALQWYQRQSKSRQASDVMEPAWIDPAALWQRYQAEPALLVLMHTGDYSLGLARILREFLQPAHFVVALHDEADAERSRALKSLENFGHKIDVVATKDHGRQSALTLARHMRRGSKVVIFADTPARIGTLNYGATQSATLCGRTAQMLHGPALLATLGQCGMLLAGHRVVPGAQSEMHLVDWVASGDARHMHDCLARSVDRFLRESPENWRFLLHAEAMFHRQVTLPQIPGVPNARAPWITQGSDAKLPR